MANPRNQPIEMPQIQYTDKIADDSVAVQRQISPRTAEHQWDDRSGGDADKDVQSNSITKYHYQAAENKFERYRGFWH